jgi:multisubunit Na+/H+ antiporter MnhB subunit
MSLKTFHLIFIIVCIVMSLGFAVWNLVNYFSPGGAVADLVIGAGSVLVAVGLVVYEAYFLKKTKNVSYL